MHEIRVTARSPVLLRLRDASVDTGGAAANEGPPPQTPANASLSVIAPAGMPGSLRYSFTVPVTVSVTSSEKPRSVVDAAYTHAWPFREQPSSTLTSTSQLSPGSKKWNSPESFVPSRTTRPGPLRPSPVHQPTLTAKREFPRQRVRTSATQIPAGSAASTRKVSDAVDSTVPSPTSSVTV